MLMLLLTNSVDHLVNAFLGSLVFVCYGARAYSTLNGRTKRETSIYLQLLLEPFNKLSQGPTAVRNLVLLHLWHFRIRLALVLEASVPTWITKENQQIDPFASPKRVHKKLTEISRSTSLNNRTLKPAVSNFATPTHLQGANIPLSFPER